MEYITVKEASELWNTDISTIGKLLRAGKIEGADKLGGHWVIPKGTPKPVDGRTNKAKESKNANGFRFPLYVNFPEESFVPALSNEESKLFRAQKDFYACKFEEAKVIFETLSETAENIYVKICANFFMCVLSVAYNTNINFNQYYYGMNLLLSDNFPYKKEMELFPALLDFCLGKYMSLYEKLNSDIQYEFHPSALYMNAFLSFFKLSPKNLETNDLTCLEAYETLCVIMERDGYFGEAQKLHAMLLSLYFSANNKERVHYHIQKAVKIAYEHNLIYTVADAVGYYSDEIIKVLKEYPLSFVERIKKSSKVIYENFARFTANNDITKLYTKLSESDFSYLSYATKGFTNKQIADILNVSERTVAKKYNDIYNKLGVTGKQDLINEIITALSSK